MRLLVVGLGSMGRRRVRNLTAIGGCEIAGVDPIEDRRRAVAVDGIETFSSLEAGLRWRPEAMVISTPPDRHIEVALTAARHGLHFFIEATVIPGETQTLIAAVGDQDLIAAPSCTLRFHPGIQLLQSRVKERAIGRPLVVTHRVGQHLADWHPWEDYRQFYVSRRATGAAREIVAFELNWMMFLFGRVDRVAGRCQKVSTLEADIDDYYAALLHFESGVEASLIVDVMSRPAARRAEVLAENGTLVWDYGRRLVSEWTATDGWRDFPEPQAIAGHGGDWVPENMYISELRAFLDAISEGSDRYPFSLAEELDLMGALTAIERSAATGTTVAPV